MKRPAGFAIAGLLGVVFFGPAPLCRAADEPPKKSAASGLPTDKPRQDLDDQLLRDLGEEPSDQKAGKSPATPKSGAENPVSKPAKQADSPLDEDLLKQLEGGDEARPAASGESAAAPAEEQGGAETGPIDRLARKMRDVQQRLAKRNGNDETQQLEHKILEELEKLIEEASQQSSSSSSSAMKQPQQQQTAERDKAQQPETGKKPGAGGKSQDSPARDSSQKLTSRKAEKPDKARLQDLMKDIWGELPPRLRQQMMQSSVEQFVPKYEFEIEEYFKTLAERQQKQP